MALGTAVGLLTGAVGGLVSGTLITKLKLQPFIATLGTMSLYRGIALVMYDGQPINVSSYRYLGEGALFGIPISVILFWLSSPLREPFCSSHGSVVTPMLSVPMLKRRTTPA